MPHNDNHNPFAIDKLISIDYDSVNPENTIYRVPINFTGEVGTGMDVSMGEAVLFGKRGSL